MPEFCYNLHVEKEDAVLAICDDGLQGEHLEEGKVSLEVKESFYCDERCGVEKARELFRKVTIINAVGENVIELLVKEGFVDKERILWLEGVPHAQMILMSD